MSVVTCGFAPSRHHQPQRATPARLHIQQHAPLVQHRSPLALTYAQQRPICSAVASDVQPEQEADLQYVHPSSGVPVYIFGVEHMDQQPHIGEWILANRPAAVIVETGATPEHGSAPGKAVTCRDQVPGAAGMFLRVLCQVAAALQEQGEAAMAPGGVWSQAAGQFNGEQLAYVAALASGSQLLFGDRPKDITYKRLFSIPSMAELDAAFSAEVAASYWAYLLQLDLDEQQQQQLFEQWQEAQVALAKTAVWNIMMREREAVMLGVVDQVCRTGLLLMPEMPKPSVALVVGSAHLQGLLELLQTGNWQQLVGEEGLSSSSPVMQAPEVPPETMQQPGAGARRGLLEAVLQLSVPEEVLQDLQDVLPPVTDGQQAAARDWAFEIYSSSRMKLASLPEPLLQQVCGAAKGSSLQEVLQPLRQLKSQLGGPAWDADVGKSLRALNRGVMSHSWAGMEE